MRSTTGIITRRRTAYIFLGVGLALFFLFGRLTYVQLIRSDLYRERALSQRLRPVPVDAKRGTIRDRRGRELAVSVSADSVYAIPAEINRKGAKYTIDQLVSKLSGALRMDESSIRKKLTTRASTVWIARKVDPEAARRVRSMRLPGIGITERSQRFYPKEQLACHILGLAGIDNQGLEGIEVYYDNYLKGAPGRIVAERDGKGRQIPQGISKFIPPQDGNDIYLTIDEAIQYVAERELDRAMEATGSTKGVIVLMDPRNGEILALVNRPGYNPNNINDYPTKNRRNTAFADSYEPGSTFKAMTAASALEERVVRPTDSFFDPGYIMVEDRRLKCWKAGGHGQQTFIQAVENSCNPVFVRLATALGKDKFYQYIKAFGFGKKTGVDFPGEAPGLMAPLQAVGPVELATIGFGQGISVTPLQIVNALCTVVNGGYLNKPHLLKQVKTQTGSLVRDVEPERVRQVISSETSKEIREILASVVANGSGKNAGVPGYRVGGKTGTAQIPDKGRYGNKVIASFMGFAPVDHPRIAGLVALYEPSTPVTFGSVLAAPVFGAIAKDALRYLEVPPTEEIVDKNATSETTGVGSQDKRVRIPDIRNMSVVDAVQILDEAGLNVRYNGDGNLVQDQVPKPGTYSTKGSAVILSLDAPKEAKKGSAVVTVPDLTGRTIKDAGRILARVGLKLNLKGTGIAARQEPEPGSRVKWGTSIRVTFKAAPEPEVPEAAEGRSLEGPSDDGTVQEGVDGAEGLPEESKDVPTAVMPAGLHP